MQAVLLSEPPALPAAGRPGRRWALQIVCGPLPTPMSESEEHDSPHFPICYGRRLCRVGSWLMPAGPLAQDGGRDDDAITPTQVPMWQGEGALHPQTVMLGVWVGFGVSIQALSQSPGFQPSSARVCWAH